MFLRIIRFMPLTRLVLPLVMFVYAFSAYSQEDLPLQRDRTLQELQELEAAISISNQQRLELVDEISQLDKDRVSINRELINASKKSRELEKRVARSEQRLSQLREEQAEMRQFLKAKEGLLSEILAALQRIGRQPPPALLVTPEDALSSVRSAILLGSVVPEVRAETDLLVRQLQGLVRISQEIGSQRNTLTSGLAGLAAEEERLNLLLDEKRKLAGVAQVKLVEEQARTVELASRATSLSGLIESLEQQIESVRKAEVEAQLAHEALMAGEEDRQAVANRFKEEEAFSDPGRKTPAISFAAAKGLLPLPVTGIMRSGFGEQDEFGERVSGMSLVTRQGSRVISPVDGWIVYAGMFRTYGQLLIINAGNDYHVVLAGLEDTNVSLGQFVIVGEPIGKMGARRIASSETLDLTTTMPTLYIEFRKDGKPIDPSPWWADTNIQRVTDGS